MILKVKVAQNDPKNRSAISGSATNRFLFCDAHGQKSDGGWHQTIKTVLYHPKGKFPSGFIPKRKIYEVLLDDQKIGLNLSMILPLLGRFPVRAAFLKILGTEAVYTHYSGSYLLSELSWGLVGCLGTMEAPLKGVYVRKNAKNVQKYAQNPAEFFTNGAFL